jgi:hypothetical protein
LPFRTSVSANEAPGMICRHERQAAHTFSVLVPV